MVNIIICFLIISYYSPFIESTHFYGGTVTWKSMTQNTTGSKIPIMFTQSYQWRRSYKASTECDQSFILNRSPLIPLDPDDLECVTTPVSSCGGYKSMSINEYCTDSSEMVDLSSGQISTVQSITKGSEFCIAYEDASWVGLRFTNCSKIPAGSGCTTKVNVPGCLCITAGWSIGCCIDLTIRPDGFINTPPVVTIISPIRVAVNTLTNIEIPVIDADNDVTRCRWAKKTSTLDECGDVCGEISGSTLDSDSCTLIFNSTKKIVGDFFAVTLMVEDFYDELSNTAFSRVPIQFLIEIIGTSICSLKPTINSSMPACIAIQVGIQFSFNLTIEQGCPGTTINDFFRMPPLNMYKSNTTQIGSSNVWMVTETWTPDVEQLGSQVYCAIATDNASIQSNQYCLTFTVFPAGQMSLCPTERSTSTITTTTTTTSTSSSSTSTTSTSFSSSSGTSASSSSTSSTSTITSTLSSSSSTSKTTSTSSISTSTASSTSSISTSKTTSTSSISTSTTSSTSSISTSTTTSVTPEQAIIVTVLVPIPSDKDPRISDSDLGLALGLGLPLMLCLSGLILYKCCCPQCKFTSSKLYRRDHNRTEIDDSHIESSRKLANNAKDNKDHRNQLPDYRQQYINDSHKSGTNNPPRSRNEKRLLTQSSSFISMPTSDFELNPMHATKTSFFSPSVCSLPNDDIQYFRNSPRQNMNSMDQGSILIRAYSIQENQKSIYTS